MQLISPRQVQHWTKTYKDRFEKLEKEGRMSEAGRKSVLISKQNGLWNFMDDVDALIKPQDFIKCLEDNPPAMQCFDSFGASSKRFMFRHPTKRRKKTAANKGFGKSGADGITMNSL